MPDKDNRGGNFCEALNERSSLDKDAVPCCILAAAARFFCEKTKKYGKKTGLFRENHV